MIFKDDWRFTKLLSDVQSTTPVVRSATTVMTAPWPFSLSMHLWVGLSKYDSDTNQTSTVVDIAIWCYSPLIPSFSHPIEGLGGIKLCKSLGPDKTFCNTWVHNLFITKGTQTSQSDWGNVTLSALQSISPGHELQADVATFTWSGCRQWLMRSTGLQWWYIWVLDDVRLWDIEVVFNVSFEIRLAQKLLCNAFF